jgi:hypothetical protein
MKNYRTFFHVPITYIPLSSSLMKYLTLPFPSSTPLALYRKVNYPQIYTPNLPTPINTFCLAAVILVMSLVKTFLDNTLFITPSFQMIFKLTQSFFQRFVGGVNSPDSKSLTVWYALSHMRRMTAAVFTKLVPQIYRWCGYEVNSEWWRITEFSFTCQ